MDGVFHVLHLGSVLLIILVSCVVILYVFMFGVPCCGVRYDFRIKRCQVRLHLRLFVEDSCLVYVICVCLRIVVSNTYCVVFLFYLCSSCS